MNVLSWAVKGFGGLVTMIENVSEAHERMDERTMTELEGYLAKLRRCLDIQRKLQERKDTYAINNSDSKQ